MTAPGSILALVAQEPGVNPGRSRHCDRAGLGRLERLAAIGEHFETTGWATLLVFLAVWAGGALWWRASVGQRAS